MSTKTLETSTVKPTKLNIIHCFSPQLSCLNKMIDAKSVELKITQIKNILDVYYAITCDCLECKGVSIRSDWLWKNERKRKRKMDTIKSRGKNYIYISYCKNFRIECYAVYHSCVIYKLLLFIEKNYGN